MAGQALDPQTPRKRPDARPMRAIIGAGGLAVASAVAAAIVVQPQPHAVQDIVIDPAAAIPGTPIPAQRPVRYVQLEPGQTAPPGARVIPAEAPTPVTVVTVVAAPAPPRRTVVVTTTQSGTGK